MDSGIFYSAGSSFLCAEKNYGTLLKRIIHFIKFYFSAKTLHGVHSPFVYDFCENILDDQRHFYAFSELHYLRKELKKNRHDIEVNDFGAGSLVLKKKKKQVSQLAKTSATRPFFAELLFRMIVHYRPEQILELGTSLGIGTLYFAKASEKTQIMTIEGCPNVAMWANHHLKWAEVNNVKLVIGRFEEQLPKILNYLPKVDLVFIDGNHRYQPTIEYFEQCLSKTSENSIIIFDDIYWSDEMLKAWDEIKNHPSVTQTIDLHQFGIVFFKKEFKVKEHWKLVPLRWKPWRIW